MTESSEVEKAVQWGYFFKDGLVDVVSSIVGECDLGDISGDGARVITWIDADGEHRMWRGVEFFINDKELEVKKGKIVNRFVK